LLPEEWDANSESFRERASAPYSIRQAERLPYNIVGAPSGRPTALWQGQKERRGIAATRIDGIVGFANYNVNHER